MIKSISFDEYVKFLGKKDPFIEDLDHDNFIKLHYHYPYRHKSGNITFIEQTALMLYVQIVKPNVIFEIGTFNGKTAINFHSNNNVAEIYTMDIPPNTNLKKTELEQKQNYKDVDELGYVGEEKLFEDDHPYIHQIWCDSAKFKPGKFKDNVDMCFIDGSHSYEYAKNDTYLALRMVKNGGVIFWHDFGFGHGSGWPGVDKWLDEFNCRLYLEGKLRTIYAIQSTSLGFMIVDNTI